MRHSISLRFNLSATAVITALLILFGAYDYRTTSAALYKQQNSEIEHLGGSLEATLAPAIWNFGTEQVQSSLEYLVSNENIEAAIVYDTGNQVFSGVAKNRSKNGARVVDKFNWDGKVVKNNLNYQDSGESKYVGHLDIFISDAAIKSELASAVWASVFKIIILDFLMLVSLTLLVKNLVVRPIDEVNIALKDIATGEGDLTQRIENARQNEIGQLANYFNTFIEKIHTSIRQVASSASNIDSAIVVSYESIRETSLQSEQELAEIDLVATAITEMSQTSLEVAGNASQAALAADQANEKSKSTQSTMKQTADSINSLAEQLQTSSSVIDSLQVHVNDIVAVLDVIRGIAEQTNLLALNAAIEAARAGEQGRGFAVVADEVRALAGRTQESTSEIQEMIERLQNGSAEAVRAISVSQDAGQNTVQTAHEAFSALQDISKAIQEINDLNTQIACAAEEQSKVTEEINRNVANIVNLTHVSSESHKRAVSASEMLSKESGALTGLVGEFKV